MYPFRNRYFKILCASTVTFSLYLVVLFCMRREKQSIIDYVSRYDDRSVSDDGNCDKKYGIRMFDEWKSTKFEICTNESTSKITCYLRYDEAVTRRLCLLINTKVRLHEPHYVANTSDLSSSAAVTMYDDIVSADCDPVVTHYNEANEHKMQFDSLFRLDKFKTSRKPDLQCEHIVSHTVFWLWRWDATNAYHFLEDITNTFVSLILFNEDPNEVEIAIYDGMGGILKNPLFTLWYDLFPKGVRIIRNNPFPRNTCFARSIIGMYGMRSHFTEFGGYKTNTRCSSPILKSFRDWASTTLQIKRTKAVTGVTLLFISRQQYLPTRNISRVLVNENDILQAIKSTFLSLNVIRFRPENYSTFKEQVEIVDQAQIMVGVHGAGLVYSLFMSPGSHLIEIFMDDRGPMNRHFYNIATWMDLVHHSIAFSGKIIPPERIVNVINVAIDDLSTKYTSD